MPFTLSHVAAVLPIHHIHRRTFLMAPLAIGSMAPDIPYFIEYYVAKSHEWSTVLPFYLPLGFGITLLWYFLLRRPFYQLLPYFFPANNPLLQTDGILNHLWRFVWVAISVLIGIATHLVWDGLTHDDHRTFMLKDTLATTLQLGHFEMPLYRVLQYVSSGFGLLVVTIYLALCFKYRLAVSQRYPVIRGGYQMALISLFCLSGGYYALENFNLFSPYNLHTNNYFLMGQVLVGFIQGFGYAFILYALAWQCWRVWQADTR